MPDTFPARLSALRRAAGLTQQQLAERTGVGQVAVARWETGTRRPTLASLRSLAGALARPLGRQARGVLAELIA